MYVRGARARVCDKMENGIFVNAFHPLHVNAYSFVILRTFYVVSLFFVLFYFDAIMKI